MDNRVVAARPAHDLEIRILGALEVWHDGTRVALGGGRRRELLALLALRPNTAVSSDVLIDALWQGTPPPTAGKALQNLVRQLRQALGGARDVLVTSPRGYELRVGPDTIDAARFERLTIDGLELLQRDPASAAKLLREALALWRGEPLPDVAYHAAAQAEIARLQELRLTALEGRIDADLALGEHAELVSELVGLVAAHPLRERLRARMMLALYRSGRQTDALDAYRQGRALLRDELGLEPGAEIRELEQAILVQDPSLGPPPRRPPVPGGRAARRLRLFAVGAAVLVGTIAVGVLAWTRDSSAEIVGDSLVKIDAGTNEVVDVVPVGSRPGPVVIVGPYVLVSSAKSNTISRVDRRTGEVVTEGGFSAPRGMAREDDHHVWVASERGDEVVEVDVDRMVPVDRLVVPSAGIDYIAVGSGSLWVSESELGAVSRWRLPTLELQARYRLEGGAFPNELGFDDGSAWIGLVHSAELLRIDASAGRTSRVSVGEGPGGPPTGRFGSIWTTDADGRLWRVDTDTGRVRSIVRLGRPVFGLAVGAGSVWVAGHDDGTVQRVDPASERVVATVETGFFPQWLAADDRYVWVGLSSAKWGFGE
jgi:DNA-binding SARP family transcriptional activator/streptogramin lyase